MQPKLITLTPTRRDFLRGAILTGASSVAMLATRRGNPDQATSILNAHIEIMKGLRSE